MKKLIFTALVCLVGCGSAAGVKPGDSNGSDTPTVPNTHVKLNVSDDAGTSVDSGTSVDAEVDSATATDASDSEDAFDPAVVCVAPTCSHQMSYWRCHHTWPCTNLKVAIVPDGEQYVLDEGEALTIMDLHTNHNMVLELLDQVIPAILNGGENIAAVEANINAARIWLMQHGFDTSKSPETLSAFVPDSSPLGQEILPVAVYLRDFNAGHVSGSVPCQCGK